MATYIYSMIIGLGAAIFSLILMILAIEADRAYAVFLGVLIASVLLTIYGLSGADSLQTETRYAEIHALIDTNNENWVLDNF